MREEHVKEQKDERMRRGDYKEVRTKGKGNRRKGEQRKDTKKE